MARRRRRRNDIAQAGIALGVTGIGTAVGAQVVGGIPGAAAAKVGGAFSSFAGFLKPIGSLFAASIITRQARGIVRQTRKLGKKRR